MRKDGRKSGEMRKVKITSDYIKNAKGSCLIEVGDTRVICTASHEEGVPRFLRGKGRGWVTAEYGMLPASCNVRSSRESSIGRKSGRTHEVQRLIGRALRSVCDMGALGENTIWIDVDVIQADGGTRCAGITGSFVACALALDKLKEEGVIDVMPLKNYLAAISVGMVEGKVYLDLAYEEDSRADVDMNIVMDDTGKFIEIQGTAENDPFDKDDMDKMIGYAAKGIKALIKEQKKVVGKIV